MPLPVDGAGVSKNLRLDCPIRERRRDLDVVGRMRGHSQNGGVVKQGGPGIGNALGRSVPITSRKRAFFGQYISKLVGPPVDGGKVIAIRPDYRSEVIHRGVRWHPNECFAKLMQKPVKSRADLFPYSGIRPRARRGCSGPRRCSDQQA